MISRNSGDGVEPSPSPPGGRGRWTDWTVCILLFLFLSSLYFATSSGITSSNDGSHYALTRAIVEKGSFEISGFSSYAEGNDIALRGDSKFSDRPPGTALVASLFYAAAGRLPSPPAQLESRHDPDNPRLVYVMLLPSLAGAGAVLLLYLLLRELGVSSAGALMASLALGLGTAHWKYSSVLFSHALSSFTVLLAVYLALRATRHGPVGWLLPLALGFILGYAVLVEYSNAILVVVVVVYLLAHARRVAPARPLLYGFLLVMGGLVPAAFLAFYDKVNFGGPFTLSYVYAVNYPWAGSLSETFSFSLGRGLWAMLVWGEGGGWCDPTCYNQGLFLLSPVLLLSLVGLGRAFRRAPRLLFLTTGLFIAYLLLFAKHRTLHGFTADGRYLVPFLGLWCVPLGFFFDRALRVRRPVWRATVGLISYGLFFLSLRNIFLHIGHSYNYHLDLCRLGPLVASPSNWAYLLGQVLRNTGNLPLLWAVEGSLLLLGLAAYKVVMSRIEKARRIDHAER